MPQNLYELIWIFIIYAFIGWCTEVTYAALDRGVFVNRGFLNGPYCPIYGCGVVIVVMILTPLKENLLLLFAGSVILTSVLEFITGFILEKAFHNKWWDYSNKPFNIKGYVCLKFSIYWGLACTFIMDILHPIIYEAIRMIPYIAGVVILSFMMCIFVVDCGITVSTILKFNKRLKIMDEMAVRIHKLSDEIGENIYENVADVIEKSEEFQENHAEILDKLSETKDDLIELPGNVKNAITLAVTEKVSVIPNKAAEMKKSLEEKRKEKEKLTAEYTKLFEQKNFGFKRLLKAFPDMSTKNGSESLLRFKKKFDIKKWRDK